MTKAVLLIDSQITSRRMLRFAMELHEYRVVELYNQAGVLAALADRCPELLILGVNAGDVGQQNLLSQLRQQPAFDVLPVLLIGEGHLRSNWDLRAIGHCSWLNKPFRIGEMHDQVATLLGHAFPPPPGKAGRHLARSMTERNPTSPRYPAVNPALLAMTGRLVEADQLTEQAFLQVGRQVEEGYRRAQVLAELAARELQLDAGETAEQTLARLQQSSAELTGRFGVLVAALQFQDITRQRLQHIREALDGLCTAAAGEVAIDPIITEVCQLQYDQMQLAIGDFDSALVTLDENLQGMVGYVQAIANDTCAALSAGSNEDCARITTIGQQAVEICTGLQTALIGSDIRRQFLAQVEPVLEALRAMILESGGIVEEGGDHRMLSDLQKHYTMMSERAVHQRFLEQHAERHSDGARPVAGSPAHDFGDNVDLF